MIFTTANALTVETILPPNRMIVKTGYLFSVQIYAVYITRPVSPAETIFRD